MQRSVKVKYILIDRRFQEVPVIHGGSCHVFHRIIPVFNGTFTVSFDGTGAVKLPKVENIPSFIFLILDEDDNAVVVDTGFRMDWIAGYKSIGVRDESQEIVKALSDRGFPPERIKTVIQTHLHWDHAAGMSCFPNAGFYLQAREFIGLLNLNPNEETYYIPGHWLHLLPRIRLVNGTYTISDGLSVMFTGGHSPGHQAVIVETRGGTVVLGGDAPFNYDSLWQTIPPEYWEMYRNGPGKHFYWAADVIPAIREFLKRTGFLDTEAPAGIKTKELLALGRCYFSHDPGLKNVGIIE